MLLERRIIEFRKGIWEEVTWWQQERVCDQKRAQKNFFLKWVLFQWKLHEEGNSG